MNPTMNPKTLSQVSENIEKQKKNIEIIPTGFINIDTYIDGGFLKKELIVLGGGTGKGKSLVAGNMFTNIACSGYKSLYISLEISNEMIVSRMIGAGANVSPTRVMIKQLTDQEIEKRDEAKAMLSVYEEFMTFHDDIYEYWKIEKAIKEGKYDFVVIDFVQNIILKAQSEYERLSTVALNLQRLAKETNTCILLLSQLSNVITREKKKDAVEFKGSGSIATVADMGLFIEEAERTDAMFTIRLRKNRRGTSGEAFHFIITAPGGKILAV